MPNHSTGAKCFRYHPGHPRSKHQQVNNIIVLQGTALTNPTSGGDNSAGPMHVLRVSGQFGPPVFIFYWPDGPLVSTMELFTIVLDSFHQLSLLNPFYPEASADELQPVPDHFLKSISQH